MNRFLPGILLIHAVLMPLLSGAAPSLQKKVYATGLACEYLVNPLGTDVPQPRLSWKVEQSADAPGNQVQNAYRILVASSSEKLAAGRGDVWDSGKIASNRSIQVVYEGAHLESMQRYWWKVKIWSSSGESEWSEPAYWVTGIIRPFEWQARWIGDKPDTALRTYKSYIQDHYKSKDFDVNYWANPPCTPSPLLRKSFIIDRQPKQAFLYVSALGYYEIWLNGNRIGDQLQAPEWTNYFDRVQYRAFDLSEQLEKGENVLAATLADGWCLGRTGGIKWMHSFPHRGFYALDRRLIAQLAIVYDDGSGDMLITDGSWKINTDGYIRRADNFTGQTIDARKIIPGWNRPGFDDTAWDRAYEDNTVKRNLVAQKNEPIRVHRELKPVEITSRDGKYTVNFGQNIAGHCALKIKGKEGAVITVRHGEWLRDDGRLYTESLGHALAVDTFILSGNDDYFDPSFTYHGFQYAEVSVPDIPLTADMISAKAVSSDPAVTGAFECSNPKLNQLYRNIVWTQRNNMYSILHDNPSRDERTGAVGDVLIFCQSSIFNMDMAAFYTKLSHDLNENAFNGQFFSMIPSLAHENFWNGWVGAPGWAEGAIIIPWRMYQNYNDIRAIRELYAAMKKHVDATERENPDLIWKVRHNHNNDWLNANTIAAPPDPTYSTTRGSINDDLFSTAFFACAAQMLSDIARTLGYAADARHYGELAGKIKAKILALYVRDDGYIEGNTQGTYALALSFDLLPQNLRDKAFARLLECIEEYDCRISTGFITTPLLMQELVNFGRTDIAYRLLESERFPSWIFPINVGATTIWERWDAVVPGRGIQESGMNSLDHVAFGAVGEWMFRHILGINPDDKHPGYGHFTIHPRPGGSLTWAKGSYNSIRGEIASEWKIEDGVFTLKVKIPANTTATIVLPVKGAIEAGSGEHVFVDK
ncbi:MAG: glycoside hydrolase family 78 protein [Tannerella sp.]|nr:glycoside hydrolase family 78 protein [Tannerella sp.]